MYYCTKNIYNASSCALMLLLVVVFQLQLDCTCCSDVIEGQIGFSSTPKLSLTVSTHSQAVGPRQTASMPHGYVVFSVPNQASHNPHRMSSRYVVFPHTMSRQRIPHSRILTERLPWSFIKWFLTDMSCYLHSESVLAACLRGPPTIQT